MAGLSERVLRLAADLRRLGSRIGPGEVAEALAAVERVGVGRREHVRAALRCTLARDPAAWGAFDALFARHFGGAPPAGGPQAATVDPSPAGGAPPGQAAPGRPGRQEAGTSGPALRDLRVPGYSPQPAGGAGWDPAGAPGGAAYAEAARRVARRLLRRPSRRYRPARRGRVPDLRRLLRRGLQWGGEPLRWPWRRRRPHPARIVLLCDVSGSMQPFGRALMRFAYALHRVLPRRVEVFAFSTSLVRISAYLRGGDPDRALRRAAAAVDDWGGGTQIARCLLQWCRRYGAPLGGGRTTVVLLSDGLDMGDRGRLEQATLRLRRHCRRLIWLNPLLSDPRYRPLARRWFAGPLPGVDAVLAAHDAEGFAGLARYLP